MLKYNDYLTLLMVGSPNGKPNTYLISRDCLQDSIDNLKLENDRCPHCGYDLVDSTIDIDLLLELLSGKTLMQHFKNLPSIECHSCKCSFVRRSMMMMAKTSMLDRWQSKLLD